MCVHACVCVYVYVYMCTCVYVRVRTCVCVFVHSFLFIYILCVRSLAQLYKRPSSSLFQVDEDMTAKLDLSHTRFSFMENEKVFRPNWMAPEGTCVVYNM